MKELLSKKTRDHEVIVILIISLLFMWGGFFLAYNPNPLNLETKAEKETEKIALEQARIAEAKQTFFGNLNLEAAAYIVYNPETGEIVASHNEKKILPLASLTKIMTVLAVSDELGPESNVTVKSSSSAMMGGLVPGERWQMANLAALTLVSSSNEGAAALAEAATTSPELLVALMNQKANALNLNSLQFTNPTGLDENGRACGEGSALDVAKLFSYILKTKPELLSATKEPVLTEANAEGFNHTVLNTNTALGEIPGLFASKTGYTDIAGGNLAVAANIGLKRPLIFVVLGSSKEGRFSDTKKLTEATLNYYASINK